MIARLQFWLALALLLLAPAAFAAPAISSISGTASTGSSITITGSGFGTKAHAGPMLWSDFDSYGNSGVVAGSGGSTAPLIHQGNLAGYATWDYGTAGVPTGNEILFNNTTPKAGSTYHARASFVSPDYWGRFLGVSYPYWTAGQKLYFSYYLRSTIPGSYPRQQKALIGYTADWSDRLYYSWAYTSSCDSTNYTVLHLSTIPYNEIIGVSSTSFNGQWIRVDNYMIQSGQSVANGRWDGTLYQQTIPARTSKSLVNQIMRTTADEVVMFALGGAYYDFCNTSPGTVDIDDVYMDSTPQRVELCDASTWAARNRCEIQLPTAWTDTGITATVKQGYFTSGTAYIYVTDGTNAANANGYAVTLGGASDTTAPTAPTLLRTDSPSTTSIVLSWTAGTDAVGPVTTDIERCTGWGCTSYSSLTNTAATTYTDSGLTSAQIYRYRIRSRDGAGNVSSYVEAYFNPRPTIAAFPGAEGHGAASIGGRGGAVCAVTNLNATGAGSLRACVDQSGPRIVVFRVGGTIELTGSIDVLNPYITIAGHTAPGGGIQLSTKTAAQTVLVVKTHNVIIQGIRARKGYVSGAPPESGDSISVRDPSTDVMLANISASWAADENMEFWDYLGLGLRRVSAAYILLSEPLGYSTYASKSILIGGDSGRTEGMKDIDVHHSALLSGGTRNPKSHAKESQFVNNVIYNPTYEFSETGGGVLQDYTGNYYKKGPGANSNPVRAFITAFSETPVGVPSIYVSGNTENTGTSIPADNWPLVALSTGSGGGQNGLLPSQYSRATPLAAAVFPITIGSALDMPGMILPNVGASRRLDCNGDWVSMRDTTDARVVADFWAGTGARIIDDAEVGGFPTIAAGTACTDTDGDGMPDAWETAQGLNPSSAADGPQLYASGYSNIERYLAGPQTKPVLSGLLPASRHPSGTSATSLQVTTSLVSNCRYGTSSAATFAAMTPFATTGGTSHSSAVIVRAGGVYRYFAKCQGSAGDISDAAEIRFSVDPVRQRERRWRR